MSELPHNPSRTERWVAGLQLAWLVAVWLALWVPIALVVLVSLCVGSLAGPFESEEPRTTDV